MYLFCLYCFVCRFAKSMFIVVCLWHLNRSFALKVWIWSDQKAFAQWSFLRIGRCSFLFFLERQKLFKDKLGKYSGNGVNKTCRLFSLISNQTGKHFLFWPRGFVDPVLGTAHLLLLFLLLLLLMLLLLFLEKKINSTKKVDIYLLPADFSRKKWKSLQHVYKKWNSILCFGRGLRLSFIERKSCAYPKIWKT